MRIKFSISGALLAFAAVLGAATSVPLPGGGTVTAKPVGNRTMFTVSGARRPFMAVRDASVAVNAPVNSLTLVGAAKGAVIIRDSYASKSGSMGYCQAGSEEYLRVLTASGPPRETLRIKISSCRENLELAQPGVKWDGAAGLLSLDWLNAGQGRAKHVIYRIAPGGSATLER